MMKEMKLSKNAMKVLEARYLLQDRDNGTTEKPMDLFRRVARHVARAEHETGGSGDAERWERIFLGMMTSLDFLPNSPTLMNAGTPLGQLSACFVIPVEDTIEDIFDAVKQMALIQRTGGGTGFSFSNLRPRNAPVSSTGEKAAGPVAFMKIFDCATAHIKQGGKRRGANMGVLRVDHPDILEFIRCKRDDRAFQNFNLSVAVTDAFMKAVKADRDVDLIPPGKKSGTTRVRAGKIFQEIVRAAWETGDPGLLFIDHINRSNPTPHQGAIEATNPCGEIPLLGYESCTLGSVNLSNMLAQDGRSIDGEKLLSTVDRSVRFLDNVITMNQHPIREAETATLGNRKIGLGIMGFSEMLIRMGISYDSDAAEKMGARIMSLINAQAFLTSHRLADERGDYPNWQGSVHARKGIHIRNAARTAIAPTGTIGIIADTTPGIEPLFALAYRRNHVLEGRNLVEVNPLLDEFARRHHLDADHIIEQVMEKGNLEKVEDLPGKMKQVFKTALEIPVERHLLIQAAFQRHVDNSVSKTINMPEAAAPTDVEKAYRMAWELGLKGITIYRYGSRSNQVLQLGTEEHSYQYDHGSKCDPEECRV